jgi:hypothetical protein
VFTGFLWSICGPFLRRQKKSGMLAFFNACAFKLTQYAEFWGHQPGWLRALRAEYVMPACPAQQFRPPGNIF